MRERTIDREESDEGSVQRIKSHIVSPNESKLESIDVTDIHNNGFRGECHNCIDLRKELFAKEKDL